MKLRENKYFRLGVGVTLILTLVGLLWFVFGWLYGPRPSIGTFGYLFSSYFKSINISSSTELISAGGDLSNFKLPPNFKLQVFAKELGGPKVFVPGVNWGVRQMTLKGDTVYVTSHLAGKVLALKDTNNDGQADETKIFLENLSLPHGIDTNGDWIYIAQNDKIIRVKDQDSDGRPDNNPEDILNLPPWLEHWTRTVRIIDSSMYVSIGSSCNGCKETNPWRAGIIKCDLDGKNCYVFATGLRNSVDFTKYYDTIYATDTGRDFLGNDIPPEEVNIIKESKNYGWPYCYGKQIHDTSFDKNINPCAETEPSFVDLPAHSTAIGITGYNGNNFPLQYQNSLYVALHGSYQSKPPVGYKIVRIDLVTGEVSDFMDGFAVENKTFGRPVHVLNYKDGLLISDDQFGNIYYVSYSA